MNYDFNERLRFSQGERGNRDAEILKHAIPNCIKVRKTDVETDRKGVDYIATLKGGAEIGVDIKARDKGISKYWKNGKEDLVLEVWSICPDEKNEGKLGWTLSDKTNVDFILYTFDAADTNNYYLLPYQLLRMAFLSNKDKWLKEYSTKYSNTEHCGKSWRTQVVYIPVNVLLDAIKSEMYGTATAM